MNKLINLIMFFWKFPDDEIFNPGIIVPLCYGLISPKELPDAEKKVLEETAKLAKIFPTTKIVFASSECFWSGCKEQEDGLKLEFLVKMGIDPSMITIAGGVNNSVEEAEKITKVSSKAARTIVICDWMHTRSARKIWKKVSPDTPLAMHSVKGDWNESLPATFQKSPARWLLANILRHVLFCIIGKRIAKIHQPIDIEGRG